MPDEKELLRRLTDLFRVTVKDGCGSLERLEVADYSLHRSESDPATADSLSFQDDIDMDHTSGCSLDKEMLPAPRPPYIRTALASSMSPAKRTLIPQRKHHKLLKDGSDSEAIDRVFTEGLKAYWNSPWASCSGGRSRWRNQYLVEFLQQRGIERSKKQVASHLQVLRNMWKGEPEYHLIAGADEAALDPDSSSSNSISSSSSLLSSLPTFVPSSPVSDSEDGGGPRSEGDGNM
ncbi:hypothetical protein L218DRAFT_621338 [Marasmius fiardii PR-910]|nr:hypothetical protein L218DRAFT_621338 [Marasmius fiardii PR-910]